MVFSGSAIAEDGIFRVQQWLKLEFLELAIAVDGIFWDQSRLEMVFPGSAMAKYGISRFGHGWR
jgi:hypothetical protein